MKQQSATVWPFASTMYSYDPNGKRVMKRYAPDAYSYSTGSAPQWEYYLYSITGQKLVTVDCNNPGTGVVCWVVGENVYFGNKLIVSNGVNVVTDRLGSVRANTLGETFAYYPYGEERTSRLDGREKFATYFRDGVGQDYADQRYYNTGTGRFWSVDPSARSAAEGLNPISWNAYGFVGGDPINFRDPHGTFMCSDCEDDDDEDFDVALAVFASSPPPRPPLVTAFTKARQRLYDAVGAIENRSIVSTDCQNDLDALSAAAGKTIDLGAIQQTLAHTSFENGLTLTLPVSALYGPGAAAAGAAFQGQEDAKYGLGQTIGDEFGRNPFGLTADTVLLGSTIFINSNLIGGSLINNEGLLFHEALHELGLVDTDIQGALGLTVDGKNTKNITAALQKDCISGKGKK